MRNPLISPHDRVIVFCAHPDDETIGAGALLSRLQRVRIVHATDGAPRGVADPESYARTRAEELRRALSHVSLGAEARESLGFGDQETSFQLPGLVQAILGRIRSFRPDVLLTHPYEGGHPDHDASAFAAHAACRLLAADGEPAPRLLEFTSYHARDGKLAVSSFLSDGSDSPDWIETLDPSAIALKGRMLSEFRTQQAMLQAFLPPRIERFRNAPNYDFTQPPHPGALFYELHDWGTDGSAWRARAGAALAELRRAREAGR